MGSRRRGRPTIREWPVGVGSQGRIEKPGQVRAWRNGMLPSPRRGEGSGVSLVSLGMLREGSLPALPARPQFVDDRWWLRLLTPLPPRASVMPRSGSSIHAKGG